MKRASPPLGAKVYVEAYKRPFTVRARDDRYAICTRPAFGSVVYFILDAVEGVRGTENLVFGFGAVTDEQCREMLERLTRGCKQFNGSVSRTEVSHRNRVPWDVVKVVQP